MTLIGSIILVLGIAAERSEYPALKYVLLGVAMTLVGFLLWNRLRKKQRSTRFSIFRKRRDDEDKEQEDQWKDPWYD